MVLRIVLVRRPVPPESGGDELVRIQSREDAKDRLLHGVSPVERELLNEALRHTPLHRSVGVAFNDHPCGSVLPGQCPDFLDDEARVRIVELLHRPAFSRLGHHLLDVPGVRIELDDHGLGEDLVSLSLDRAG